MKVTLISISDKLIKLAEEEEKLYPDYSEAELAFVSLEAKLMDRDYPDYATLREKEAIIQREIEETPEYITYHKLKKEYHIHEMQTRIYLQLARNLTAIQYSQ